MKNQPEKNIVIVGASIGSMAAAAYLAKAGHTVTIYEKNRSAGATERIIKKKGFTFDLNLCGPLQTELLRPFFADFATTLESEVDMVELSSPYRLFTPETDYAVPTGQELYELFDALQPGSSKRLSKLMKRVSKDYKAIVEALQQQPGLPQPKRGLRPKRRTVEQFVNGATTNRDLQHMLTLPLLATGGKPEDMPSEYLALSRVLLGDELMQPTRGLPAVSAAVQKIAKKAGVMFCFNSPVSNIVVTSNQVSGVVVKGKTVACNRVLVARSMQAAEDSLLAPEYQSYPAKFWQKRDFGVSWVVACLGVKQQLAELQPHNVLLDITFDSFMSKLFTTKDWTSKPALFVDLPSKLEPKYAPKGGQALVLHIPVAHGVEPTQDQLERLVLSSIGRLQQQLGYEFMTDIVTADIKSPHYFADMYGHEPLLLPSLSQLAKLQSQFASRKVKGLYYLHSHPITTTASDLMIASAPTIAQEIT